MPIKISKKRLNLFTFWTENRNVLFDEILSVENAPSRYRILITAPLEIINQRKYKQIECMPGQPVSSQPGCGMFRKHKLEFQLLVGSSSDRRPAAADGGGRREEASWDIVRGCWRWENISILSSFIVNICSVAGPQPHHRHQYPRSPQSFHIKADLELIKGIQSLLTINIWLPSPSFIKQ